MSQTGQSDDQSISSQVHKIIDDLIAFDKDSRVRIYRTVGTFFGFDGVEPPRPGGADAPPTPPGASREPHFSESPQMRVGSGGASSMPPQQRNSIEINAPGEWKP